MCTYVFLLHVAALSHTMFIFFNGLSGNFFTYKNFALSIKDFKVTNQRLGYSKPHAPLREGRSNSTLAESKHQLSPVGREVILTVIRR